jgi:hypothetical protein
MLWILLHSELFTQRMQPIDCQAILQTNRVCLVQADLDASSDARQAPLLVDACKLTHCVRLLNELAVAAS